MRRDAEHELALLDEEELVLAAVWPLVHGLLVVAWKCAELVQLAPPCVPNAMVTCCQGQGA